jgi:hypothetical protein
MTDYQEDLTLKDLKPITNVFKDYKNGFYKENDEK